MRIVASHLTRKEWSGGILVLFVVMIAWSVTSCASSRRSAMTKLQQTPEYRCLAASSPRSPYVKWTGLRNLKTTNTGYPVALLRDLSDTDCIPGGDAVSYAHLPTTSAGALSLVRIPGATARSDHRARGEWADVIGEGGTVRYRNDGEGYRQVTP